jgi:PhoPQ-activated pathogenicity-related protein
LASSSRWKRRAATASSLIPALALCAALQGAAHPVEKLFPPEQIRDVATLELKAQPAREFRSALDMSRRLTRIDLEFTSFEWAGEKWRHPATVLLPERTAERYKGAGVVLSESRPFEQGGALREYAEAAALMGIPALFIGHPNPGPRYGFQGEGDVMGHGQQMFQKTGDARWIGYAWLARVIARAATALASIREAGAERFVVSGCSKRGEASWIAVNADDRVAGAYPTCWNAGNVLEWTELKAQRWGLDYEPRPNSGTIAPASLSTRAQREHAHSPRGREYLAFTDPYRFRERLRDKRILYAAGTNDRLFPAVSDRVFLPEMGENVRILLVPNTGHTPGTPQHLAAWRMWLAHTFGGRDVPLIRVEAHRRADSLAILARVQTRTAVEAVTVWHAADERGAYRDVKWEATPLAPRDGVYRGVIPAPLERYTAWFVEVRDNDPETVPGIVTSGMQEARPQP